MCSDAKEEKDAVKTEEPAKLQNGDNTKEGATPGASEEKKKTKTRFMFNIADGGFTGQLVPLAFLLSVYYVKSFMGSSLCFECARIIFIGLVGNLEGLGGVCWSTGLSVSNFG